MSETRVLIRYRAARTLATFDGYRQARGTWTPRLAVRNDATSVKGLYR